MIHRIQDEMVATEKNLQRNQIENLTQLNENLKELCSKIQNELNLEQERLFANLKETEKLKALKCIDKRIKIKFTSRINKRNCKN
jgi:ribosomal 50S subunit-associated protein YjgA (DUF615 family)